MVCSSFLLFGILGALVGGRILGRRFGGGHFHGRHAFARHRARRARFVARRIGARPDQEPELYAVLADLEQAFGEARVAASDVRGDVGEALRQDALDDASAARAFDALDRGTGRAKDALRAALVRLHGVLDPVQRERLAGILERWGGGGWGGGRFGGPRGRGPRGGGPYREATAT